MWFDTGMVVVYLAVLAGIGIYTGRQVKDVGGFTAAGGKYGTMTIFASLSASYIGGGYSSGNAAEAFSNGIGMTLALFGFSITTILIGKFLVPGVEKFKGAATVGSIIGLSYGRAAQVLTGIFSFICCAGVVGAQMGAIGMVFNVLLGIEPRIGILIGCGIVILYSTTGGLQSVIMADIVQFVMLAAGMPLLLLLSIRQAGGLGTMLGSLPPKYLNPFNGTTPAGFLSMFITMMFGEALAPPYTQRLLIGRNPRGTARATVLSGLFSMPVFVLTGLIGMAAFSLNVTNDATTAMPALVKSVLPPGMRGLVMASMVSIILSAADGFLNGASVGLVCDTIKVVRPSISGRSELWWLRGINLVTGAAAVLVAFILPGIFNILVLAYSFWSPLILVPLAAALLGIKSNGTSFRRALEAGLVSSLLWNHVLHKPWGIDGNVVGIFCNLVVFVLCTRSFNKYREQRLLLCDKI
ncbi:MAG: sodium:solute symporter family protein [Oscillospiraceae bacterium]|nr:sodium:solute symporter family protein [Oscillospiraceae bacterium]